MNSDGFTGLSPVELSLSIMNSFGGMIFVISTIFQIIKILRTKSAKDLSYIWLILSLVALLIGFIYGVYFRLWAIYLTNALQLITFSIIFILKIKYR
jgi:MtN3 and saliva related transmembrane protein